MYLGDSFRSGVYCKMPQRCNQYRQYRQQQANSTYLRNTCSSSTCVNHNEYVGVRAPTQTKSSSSSCITPGSVGLNTGSEAAVGGDLDVVEADRALQRDRQTERETEQVSSRVAMSMMTKRLVLTCERRWFSDGENRHTTCESMSR
jgi:hypothetical protein